MAKSPRKLAARLTLQVIASLPPGAVTKAAGAAGGLAIPVSVFEDVACQFFEAQQKQTRRVDRVSRQLAELHSTLSALQGRGVPAPQQPAVHAIQPFDVNAYRLALMQNQPPPPRNGRDLGKPSYPPGSFQPPPSHPEAPS